MLAKLLVKYRCLEGKKTKLLHDPIYKADQFVSPAL